MYLEGYEWEGLVESPGSGGPRPTGEVVNKTQSTTFSMVPGEVTAFGFREKTI